MEKAKNCPEMKKRDRLSLSVIHRPTPKESAPGAESFLNCLSLPTGLSDHVAVVATVTPVS